MPLCQLLVFISQLDSNFNEKSVKMTFFSRISDKFT